VTTKKESYEVKHVKTIR